MILTSVSVEQKFNILRIEIGNTDSMTEEFQAISKFHPIDRCCIELSVSIITDKGLIYFGNFFPCLGCRL